MCFLPVKCLKAIVFIGSICAIAISIGLLARSFAFTQSPYTSKLRRNKSSVRPARERSLAPSSHSIFHPSYSGCWEWPVFRAPWRGCPKNKIKAHVCWASSPSESWSSSLSSSQARYFFLLARRPSSEMTARQDLRLLWLMIYTLQAMRHMIHFVVDAHARSKMAAISSATWPLSEDTTLVRLVLLNLATA